MGGWIRIPIDLPNESDRRTILSILSDNGLEVRVKKEKAKTRYQRFIEFKEQAICGSDADGQLRGDVQVE